MSYIDLVVVFLSCVLAWCVLAFGLALWAKVAVWVLDQALGWLARLGARVRGH